MTARNHDDAETIVKTVDLISKKWHPVIIRRLAEDGPLRFSELKDRVEGISGKVLTDSLEDLLENEIIERDVVCESPLRVEYDLAPAGRRLDRVLGELLKWGDRHINSAPRPTVLIVDDDPRVVRMYADWLHEEYVIKRAYCGRDAIRELTDDVDLVLVDRRMGGLQGEDLLDRIDEFDHTCRTVVVSAVEPDVDIVDMKFDDYLVKPVRRDELVSTVDEVLHRDTGLQPIREYRSWVTKRARLLESCLEDELRESEEFGRIEERISEIESTISDRAGSRISSYFGAKIRSGAAVYRG